MKTRHLIMAIVLAVAAWLAFFGDKSPSTKVSSPVVRKAVTSKTTAMENPTNQNIQDSSNKTIHVIEILALQERETLIGSTHRKSSGKGLFGSQNWTPPPPPTPPAAPPPPPMAPPLPYTYIGKKFENNRWEVYLARGEQTYIVLENTVLENIYHVDSIKPPTLSLTYLPLQQIQTLTIGGID
jgi:hypothetical protein